jgi:hypothetical protein
MVVLDMAPGMDDAAGGRGVTGGEPEILADSLARARATPDARRAGVPPFPT